MTITVTPFCLAILCAGAVLALLVVFRKRSR